MDLKEYIQLSKLRVETARAENRRTSDALKEAQDELFRQNEAVLAPLTRECHRAREALSEAERALHLSSVLRAWLDTDDAPSILALTAPLDHLPTTVAMYLQSMALIELSHKKEIKLTDLGERVVALLQQLD